MKQRQYFRIDDQVAMKIRVLAAAQANEATTLFEASRNGFEAANELALEKERHQASFREVGCVYPEVAGYIAHLEHELHEKDELLTRQQEEEVPARPTHLVNLGIDGVRFGHPEYLSFGTLLEITLHLYPSLAHIFCLGTVIWSQPPEDKLDGWTIGVQFTHISDADRDLLTGHIQEQGYRGVSLKQA